MDVARGELLGIVGESGSGKSVAMLALMGLVDAPGRVSAEALRFDGHDLLTLSAAQRRRIVGRDMAMIFQDAMTSLNPSYTVGFQMRETLKPCIWAGSGAALDARVLQLVAELRRDPGRQVAVSNAYPHRTERRHEPARDDRGGAGLRAPLLVADEPTTALDVTIQAQVLDAAGAACSASRTWRLILITHDLARAGRAWHAASP